MGKAILACAASLVALTTAPAYAQSNTGAAPEDAAVQGGSGGEIIVTARRREERLQDVPISVTALSGAALEAAGIRSAADLQVSTPGLTATSSNNDRSLTTYAIRGQRSVEYSLLTDPPIGTYFAEVVQPRAYGFSRSFFDIQSTQVLKGVQGTLFGRNMTGGAILVEPNHPTHKLEAEANALYGRYDARQLTGMVNVPLSDGVSIRLAGTTRKRDGYARDVSDNRRYEDENYDAFRASLLFEPTSNLTNLTIFDYYRSREHGSVPFLTAIDATTPGRTLTNYENLRRAGRITTDVPAAFAAARALFAADRFTFDGALGDGDNLDAFKRKPFNNIDNIGFTNRTELALDALTIKNIFGYRQVERQVLLNFLPVSAHLLESLAHSKIQNYSEELQLQGKALDGALDYTTGLYFFREEGLDQSTSSQFPQLAISGAGRPVATTDASLFLMRSLGRGTATTYAGYGAATYSFAEKWKLSAGLRYTRDSRRAVITPQRPNLQACLYDPDGAGPGAPLPFTACRKEGSHSWDAFTWDATLQYLPSEGINLYGSVRRGFRSGGYNLRATNDTQFKPFEPETVTEFELGAKGRQAFTGGVLTFDAAAYFQLYKNIQRQTVVLLPGGGVSAIILNRARQNNYGGEVTLGAQFDNGVSLQAFYAYVGVKVLRYADGTSNPDGTFALIGLPHHQLGGSIRYDHDLGSSVGGLGLSLDALYKGRQNLDDRDVPAIEPGYAIMNGRITLRDVAGSHFSVAGFVTNITNKLYRQATSGQLDSIGSLTAIYGEPRMYGIEVKWKL